MSILSINGNILNQFLDWRCLFSPSFLFFYLLPKAFLFPINHQICLRKTTILNLFTIGSLWNLSNKFATQFRVFSPLGIMKRCQSWEKYCSHHHFFFPTETQSYLDKTMILDSLFVGFSQNLNMLFEIQMHTPSPLGFAW